MTYEIMVLIEQLVIVGHSQKASFYELAASSHLVVTSDVQSDVSAWLLITSFSLAFLEFIWEEQVSECYSLHLHLMNIVCQIQYYQS